MVSGQRISTIRNRNVYLMYVTRSRLMCQFHLDYISGRCFRVFVFVYYFGCATCRFIRFDGKCLYLHNVMSEDLRNEMNDYLTHKITHNIRIYEEKNPLRSVAADDRDCVGNTNLSLFLSSVWFLGNCLFWCVFVFYLSAACNRMAGHRSRFLCAI